LPSPPRGKGSLRSPEAETGLDNSTLLEPREGEQSDYVLINHARWDGNLLLFMARQLPKKSFRSYMLANLKAHHLAAMPVLLPSGLACAADVAAASRRCSRAP
jgi:hypothetical protein